MYDTLLQSKNGPLLGRLHSSTKLPQVNFLVERSFYHVKAKIDRNADCFSIYTKSCEVGDI